MPGRSAKDCVQRYKVRRVIWFWACSRFCLLLCHVQPNRVSFSCVDIQSGSRCQSEGQQSDGRYGIVRVDCVQSAFELNIPLLRKLSDAEQGAGGNGSDACVVKVPAYFGYFPHNSPSHVNTTGIRASFCILIYERRRKFMQLTITILMLLILACFWSSKRNLLESTGT